MSGLVPLPENTPGARILGRILESGRSPLGPGQPKTGTWREDLAALSDTELLGLDRIIDEDAAACVRSGLLLLGDDLDRSHTLSQSIDSPDGNFWHGIMHRREPDYGNSKYWFRRVGDHPTFDTLPAHVNAGPAADEITVSGSWDPFAMVDIVEDCERGARSELRDELESLQELEMLALLTHCYSRASGR